MPVRATSNRRPAPYWIVLLDQAGWHGAKVLKIPRNLSLMPLRPRSPELNLQENIWHFIAPELAPCHGAVRIEQELRLKGIQVSAGPSAACGSATIC